MNGGSAAYRVNVRALAAVGITAALLGAPMLTAGFMFADDLSCVASVTEAVRAGWFHVFDRLYGSPYRPVQFGWIACNYALWGAAPAMWRTATLVLEGLAAVGVAWLLARTGARPGWAVGGALLWACIPGRFEPDVLDGTQKALGTLFMVGSAIAGWRWFETGRPRWLAFASVSFGLGMFAYPIAAAVPLGLWLLPPPPGRTRWPVVLAFLPWTVGWFCSEVVVTALLGGTRFPSSLDQGWLAPAWYAKNVVSSLARALLPFSVDLDLTDRGQQPRWVLEAVLKLVAVGGVMWLCRRAWRTGAGGRLWVGWLVGAVGFVALRWIVDASHLVLVAIGLVGLLATVVPRLSLRVRRATAAGAALLGVMGIVANVRTAAMAKSAGRIVETTIAALRELPPDAQQVTIYNLPRSGRPPGAIVYAEDEQISRAMTLFRRGLRALHVRVATGPVPHHPEPGARFRYLDGRLVRMN